MKNITKKRFVLWDDYCSGRQFIADQEKHPLYVRRRQARLVDIYKVSINVVQWGRWSETERDEMDRRILQGCKFMRELSVEDIIVENFEEE